MTLETYIKAIAIALGCAIVLLGAKYVVRAMRARKTTPMPTYVINVEPEPSIMSDLSRNDLDMTTTCTTKIGSYEKFSEELGVI